MLSSQSVGRPCLVILVGWLTLVGRLVGQIGQSVDLDRSVSQLCQSVDLVQLDLLVGRLTLVGLLGQSVDLGQSVGRSARCFRRPMNVSFGDLMLLDSQDLLQTSGVIATVSAIPENSSCIIVEY